MPERLQIATIDYQRHLLQDEEFGNPPSKLVPNLYHKTNCIIHYHKSTNSRRVLFNYHGWKTTLTSTLVNVQLRKMILKKSSLRRWSKRSLVSIFVFIFICSLLFLCIDSFINSFNAGKTMENLRNRHTVDLVTSEEKLKKFAAQPSFKQFKSFNENLVAVERVKFELMLNWPIYVGFVSKTLMYDFRYNYIKRKYPGSTLLFSNTDSFTY